MENMKEIMECFNKMPEEELKHISKEPKKAYMDMQVYTKCVKEGNMHSWEKLKKIRQIFNS